MKQSYPVPRTPSPWRVTASPVYRFISSGLFHGNGLLQHAGFPVWFTSEKMFWRFLDAGAGISTSFLLVTEKCGIVGLRPHFIHASEDGPLLCFYLLAIVKRAAVNSLSPSAA